MFVVDPRIRSCNSKSSVQMAKLFGKVDLLITLCDMFWLLPASQFDRSGSHQTCPYQRYDTRRAGEYVANLLRLIRARTWPIFLSTD